MTVRNYKDRDVIFSQGDNADAVFYIQNGTVKPHGSLLASHESHNRPSAAK
jgi:hypothetical protein